MVPDSPRGRLRWAVTESLVIAGILLFWVVVAIALNAMLGLVTAPIRVLALEPLGPVYRFVNTPALGWATVLPLAYLSAGLYVLVRAGLVMLDRYLADGTGDRSPAR